MTLQIINILTVLYTVSPSDSALIIDISLYVHLKRIGRITVWTQQSSLPRKYNPSHSPTTLTACTFFFYTLDPSKPTKPEL